MISTVLADGSAMVTLYVVSPMLIGATPPDQLRSSLQFRTPAKAIEGEMIRQLQLSGELAD